MRRLEVCVEDAAGIEAALAGGADRLELCAALALGGLTPSAGLMALAAAAPVPVMAMIRPRAGDFCWSGPELAAMEAEIAAARAAGLAGVVIGAGHADGRLDLPALARLRRAAEGMDVTLHRVIDLCPDPVAAMAEVAGLGITRVLSSGGALRAPEGAAVLGRMAAAAPGVVVMPGAGVDAESLPALARALRITEVHGSCSAPLTPAPALARFGFSPPGARATSADKVAALRRALLALP